MSMISDDFFDDNELKKEYNFKKYVLPQKNDCLLYVISRTHTKSSSRVSHNQAVRQMAVIVEKIWNDADCCPMTKKHIMKLFNESVWKPYYYLKQEKHLPSSSHAGVQQRSHKKDLTKVKPQEPKRRSSRQTVSTGTSAQESNEKEVESIPLPVSPMIEPPFKTRRTVSLRKLWDDEEGNKLFDVLSETRVKKHSENKLYFDQTFYQDQKTSRAFRMLLSKVTNEYLEAERARMMTEARKEARKRSALGQSSSLSTKEDDLSDQDTEDEDEDNWDADYSVSAGSEPSADKSTQTSCDYIEEDIPLRMKPLRAGKSSTLVEPRYLEAMALLMSDNLSATEAIKAVYTIDTVVWGQKRFLPLRLDKAYTNAFSALKKIQPKADTIIAHINDDFLDSASSMSENNDSDDNASNTVQISKLRKIISEKINERKLNPGSTLPDPGCIRSNHKLLSVYCEKRIAEEMVEKKAFILPDGTSRQGVGEIAAAVVKVGDKIRALKSLQISKGNRNNWAIAIIHMLDRLATSSNVTVDEIWQSITTMVSDLCKVNKALAVEIQSIIGSAWCPGQAFCNLHFTLAIPEAIKTVLGTYQSYIGADKLFPQTVSFEMNMEDKLVVVQILDCWMRLTSIRWQARAWNKYQKFTDFAEQRSYRNVGHMLHANRFGEFEERCAGGLYLADVWMEWLDTFADVRNQLSCYLRTVCNLMDMSKFLWAGAALIGIHITVPFMSMLLNHRVTPRQLLVILPELYHDLCSYPLTMTNMKRCAIPSLAPFFLDPLKKESSPYGVNVCQKLAEYVVTSSTELMDSYLKQVCDTLGVVLKRQRGDQYGFGDDANSDLHILKNMTEKMLDDSDAAHTKSIENYFGNADRGISKTGSQGFDKVADDLVIKYSRDFITAGEHQWRTKAIRKIAAKLEVKQDNFNKKQKALVAIGVDEEDAVKLVAGNKIMRCVAQCKKSHGGPLTTAEEINDIVKNWTGMEKALHSALDLEIRFRKFTFTTVKAVCPLFKQRGLSVEQKVKNISSLIDSQLDLKALADMTDLESAINALNENAPDEREEETQEIVHQEKESMKATQECKKTNDSDWPPKQGDFIIGAFEDGVYPGSVNHVDGEYANCDFMEMAKVTNANGKSLWKWPSISQRDNQILHKKSILPIKPVLDIAIEHTTCRIPVMELKNVDLVEKFA